MLVTFGHITEDDQCPVDDAVLGQEENYELLVWDYFTCSINGATPAWGYTQAEAFRSAFASYVRRDTVQAVFEFCKTNPHHPFHCFFALEA